MQEAAISICLRSGKVFLKLFSKNRIFLYQNPYHFINDSKENSIDYRHNPNSSCRTLVPKPMAIIWYQLCSLSCTSYMLFTALMICTAALEIKIARTSLNPRSRVIMKPLLDYENEPVCMQSPSSQYVPNVTDSISF